jgi:exodeoxyribonuclease VII large subunit
MERFGSNVTLSQNRLQNMTQLLQSFNPLHVLKRGYTMTLRSDGRMVRSAKDVADGETITTKFADGDIHSTVTR